MIASRGVQYVGVFEILRIKGFAVGIPFTHPGPLRVVINAYVSVLVLVWMGAVLLKPFFAIDDSSPELIQNLRCEW